jgi:hypothetical protein
VHFSVIFLVPPLGPWGGGALLSTLSLVIKSLLLVPRSFLILHNAYNVIMHNA